ncbi:signal peptidase II [Rhodanobacter denitrificans]|jgi:signal peptidase II|uniref:signal peptidase II n=1 Tax=Rhodanobacter denitrificans TaxID=666685 RepID=UPI000260EE8E|nr:signal peptidase II [Rhodanobacter denitrificans]EIM03844.1 lipoprotein signal peptidase [Rhodanobacter denitrificans]UJM92021.1 signal peptidase II [Rhodanobacter denitrificans]
MSWKFFLYDWGGLNIALFQAINTGTPAALGPLAWFFSLVGSYWTAPLMMLGLWWWSKSATDPARGVAVLHRLIGFSVAFSLALLAATVLKLWLDFPRPPAVLGDVVRVIGDIERHFSLPSGHATYAALVVGALWPLMGRLGRIGLVLYAALVGWSRIAAGVHFPADVLAGWGLGWICTALAGWLIPLAAPMWQSARRTSVWVWFAVAAAAVMIDQLAKFAITRTFASGEQVEITPFFNLVHVLNPGAAFSFLAGAGGWQRYFFIALALIVSAWLGRMLRLQLPRLEAAGYSVILGGALSNVADRVLRGQVVDFLDFHWRLARWPAFNFADVAISLGAFCLIYAAMSPNTVTKSG